MDLIIIGAGGHGKVVLDILLQQRGYRVVGFLDADPNLHGTKVLGFDVIGGANLLPKLKSQKVRTAIVAIGDNKVRRNYLAEIRAVGLDPVNAIHPAASVSASARLGVNVVVCAGAVIGVDTSIGDSSIINTRAAIDHECVIGQAVHVAPGATLAGRVNVGDEAFIGLGANVIQCLTIGERSLVAAGATVIRDVPAGARVAGVPAKMMR